MAATAFDLGEAFEILDRTPRVLEALVSGLSPAWCEANEGPATYSPRDVLCHLIFGEETDWVPRLRIILEHGASRPFDPFDRSGGDKYNTASIAELLARFRDIRAENLEYVRSLNLDAGSLQYRGVHPALGTVNLQQLIACWTVHDLGHIAQIVRTLSKRYDQAVGPWKEYLSILRWNGSAG